jgi:hypothetical protein
VVCQGIRGSAAYQGTPVFAVCLDTRGSVDYRDTRDTLQSVGIRGTAALHRHR